MGAEHVERLDGLIRHPPFHAWLGVEAVEAEPGRAVLRIPPNPDFVGNPFIPAVHGGILAALIDLGGNFDAKLHPFIAKRWSELSPAEKQVGWRTH